MTMNRLASHSAGSCHTASNGSASLSQAALNIISIWMGSHSGTQGAVSNPPGMEEVGGRN